MKYYSLTIGTTSNSYSAIIQIDETNADGDLLEATGRAIFEVQNGLCPEWVPKGLQEQEDKILFYLRRGTIGLTHAQIKKYAIWGTTIGLNTLHDIYDAITNNAQSAL